MTFRWGLDKSFFVKIDRLNVLQYVKVLLISKE